MDIITFLYTHWAVISATILGIYHVVVGGGGLKGIGSKFLNGVPPKDKLPDNSTPPLPPIPGK